MSLESRFTEEEMFLLTNTPAAIGSVMAFAEGSGLGTVKEVLASSSSIVAGIKAYPNNEIITGILPTVGNFKEAMSKAGELREKSISRLKEQGIDSTEKLREQLMADCKAVSTLLEQKASPQEATEYKQWAMSVAENVAKAAREGGFLGFGGTQISAGEQDAFAQIGAALGVASSTLA